MRERIQVDWRLVRMAAAALVVLGVIGAGCVYVPKGVHAVAHSEIFRVGEVELEGARFLSLEDAAAAASVPLDASVWDDPSEWEARLGAHPLVRTAEVRRRLPTTLVLVVEEREPVGFAATPTLEPVDAQGRLLPLDPATHALDLPLLLVDDDAGNADSARAQLAAQVARLGEVDPEFLGRVSEIERDAQGEWIARWSDPAVAFRFGGSVTARRLREGMLVLADATSEAGGVSPATVDLRFADQVVVRRGP